MQVRLSGQQADVMNSIILESDDQDFIGKGPAEPYRVRIPRRPIEKSGLL